LSIGEFSLLISRKCAAKINIYLEILGKRSDGFHEIGTLFQTINHCDILSAEPYPSVTLQGGEGLTPSPEDNLVIRAARLLKTRYGVKSGVRFFLEKNLPAAAGLGGGSSDAAGALVLCNKIWNLKISLEELTSIAAEIGADCPFFIKGGSSFGSGKGDRLENAPAPYPFHILIATPHCRVSTARAYAGAKTNPAPRFYEFKKAYARYCGSPQFYEGIKNDFEPSVFSDFPEIRELGKKIKQFMPVKTLLSGSGSSLFALFTSMESAKKAEKSVYRDSRFCCVTSFRGFF
jgi:4-diphosphocytidyl-2-C-methyl-D-erythritol kinase